MKIIKKLSSLLMAFAIAITFMGVLGVAKVNAEDLNFNLVTDVSTLAAGDQVIFACNTKSSVAGTISSEVMSKQTGTFSSDKSTCATANAVVMTLGGETGAWTFSVDGKLLGATAVKKLDFGKGTTTWTISISSNGTATVTSTNTAYGTMQYNPGSPRFTTYTSAQTAIQIYKLSTEVSSTAIVAFDANGGKFTQPENTTYEKGSLIVKPEDPTLKGYKFDGWYNGDVEWVFENDQITTNLTLTAKWTILPETTFGDTVNLMTALLFSYQMSDEKVGCVESTSTKLTFSGSGAYSSVSKNSPIDVHDRVLSDASGMFDFKYLSNNTTNAYVGGSANEVRLYAGSGNGSAFQVVAKDDTTVITNISCNVTNTNLTCSVSEDGKTATIQNTGTGTTTVKNITEVTVEFTCNTEDYEYTVNNAAVRFTYSVPKALYNQIIARGENVEFGFKINDQFYSCVAEVKEDTVDFSLLVKNIPSEKFDTEFTKVYGYVSIDGAKTMTSAISCSVKSIANDYVTKYADLEAVKAHVGVLTYLSKFTSTSTAE